MTSTVAPPTPSAGPPPRRAVVRFVGSLHGALDRLAELRLRVPVAADRNQVGSASGATSTPAWLAHEPRTTRTSCFRDLHLAEKLDDRFEVTRRALAAGSIDAE